MYALNNNSGLRWLTVILLFYGTFGVVCKNIRIGNFFPMLLIVFFLKFTNNLAFLKSAGESLNTYVRKSIDQRMEREAADNDPVF